MPNVFDELLMKYRGLSGAKACKYRRSRQEVSNEYLVAKFGVRMQLLACLRRYSRERVLESLQNGSQAATCRQIELGQTQAAEENSARVTALEAEVKGLKDELAKEREARAGDKDAHADAEKSAWLFT